MNALELLQDNPVIPVIVIRNAECAAELAQALFDGGIRCLEITLRSGAALDAVRRIRRALPQAMVGVGTIHNAAELRAAIDAGAQFGVSPGLTDSLAKAVKRAGIPFLPGVATASESMHAADLGFSVQKLFPADAIGGVALLKALHGPLPDISYCPTGGINAGNAARYLELPNVLSVGGSWLTPHDVLARGQWGAITALARQACLLAQAGTGPH